MALVKCKECSREVSSKATACPGCGVKMPKKTSVITWIVGGFFAVTIIVSIVSANNQSAAKAARTPEQVAGDAKKEAAFQKVAAVLSSIKSAMRDPESIKWESVLANDDSSVVCAMYRAKNGFGGTSVERATYANGKLSTAASAWNKSCAGKTLTDMSHARLAVR